MPDTPPASQQALPEAVIVTADPVVLDELLRLCAAAGVRAAVAGDAEALDAAWTRPGTLLVGADLAPLAYERGPHAGVVVVGTAARPPWEAAARLSAGRVAVLPAASAWLVDHLATGPGSPAPAAPVVCLLGGHGGAGATTLAAALARTAASRVPRGRPPVLAVDADTCGSGLDLTLGLDAAAGSRWSDVLGTSASAGVPEQLLDLLPGRAGLRLLAVDDAAPARLPVDALRAAVVVASRTAGLVVVDLPADPQVCAAVLPSASLVCVVARSRRRAVTAARRRLQALPLASERSTLVVRTPGDCAPAAVGEQLRLPVFGVLGPEPGLDRDYARGAPPGRPRGPLSRLCGALLLEATGSAAAGAAA